MDKNTKGAKLKIVGEPLVKAGNREADERRVKGTSTPSPSGLSKTIVDNADAPPSTRFISSCSQQAHITINLMAELCQKLILEAEQVERAVGSAQSHAISLGKKIANESVWVRDSQRLCVKLENAIAKQHVEAAVRYHADHHVSLPNEMCFSVTQELAPLTGSLRTYIDNARQKEAMALIAQKVVNLDPNSKNYELNKIQLQYFRAYVLFTEGNMRECASQMDEARHVQLPDNPDNVVIYTYVYLLLIKALMSCQVDVSNAVDTAVHRMAEFERITDMAKCDTDYFGAVQIARRQCHMVMGVALVSKGNQLANREIAKCSYFPPAERHLRCCLELVRSGVVEGLPCEEKTALSEALINVCVAMDKAKEAFILASRLIADLHNDFYPSEILSIQQIAECQEEKEKHDTLNRLVQTYAIFRKPVTGEQLHAWKPLLAFLIRMYNSQNKKKSAKTIMLWCSVLYPHGSKI